MLRPRFVGRVVARVGIDVMDMQWSCHVTDERMNYIRVVCPSRWGIERAMGLADCGAESVRKAAILKKLRCVAELKPHRRDVAKDSYQALPEKAGCHHCDSGDYGMWPPYEAMKAPTGGVAYPMVGESWLGDPWLGRL